MRRAFIEEKIAALVPEMMHLQLNWVFEDPVMRICKEFVDPKTFDTFSQKQIICPHHGRQISEPELRSFLTTPLC